MGMRLMINISVELCRDGLFASDNAAYKYTANDKINYINVQKRINNLKHGVKSQGTHLKWQNHFVT